MMTGFRVCRWLVWVIMFRASEDIHADCRRFAEWEVGGRSRRSRFYEEFFFKNSFSASGLRWWTVRLAHSSLGRRRER